jgi:hypothetical protein
MAADEDSKKVKLELDVETAFKLDELLRDALVASRALAPDENRSIRPERVSVSLDDKTAAFFSNLLREGLIEAGAAHESNNRAIAQAIKKLAGE